MHLFRIPRKTKTKAKDTPTEPLLTPLNSALERTNSVAEVAESIAEETDGFGITEEPREPPTASNVQASSSQEQAITVQGAVTIQPQNATSNPSPPVAVSRLEGILQPVHAGYDRTVGHIARCQQGTRHQIIQKLTDWATGDTRPVCWLSGSAGSGKSAISQTIAEQFAENGQLAGSFFFLRGAGPRSTISSLIPSLAFQLSSSVPTTKPAIEFVIESQPTLLRAAPISEQLEKLLIEPLRAARKSIRTPIFGQSKHKPTIVIDALDECDDKDSIYYFISAIVDFASRKDYLPFKLLLTSRMENHIRNQLERASSCTCRLSLQDYDATNDIRYVLRSHFDLMYPNMPFLWPDSQELEALVRKAGGSFIVASTLFNFITDGTEVPEHKLSQALASRTDTGLDLLYQQVLQLAPPNPHTSLIVDVIMLLREPFSVISLGRLLQIDPREVVNALVGVQSIILIPDDDRKPVLLCHTSLRDFFTSSARSGQFYTNAPPRHVSIVSGLLTVLEHPPHDNIFLDKEDLGRYACRYWVYHLQVALDSGKDTLISFSKPATVRRLKEIERRFLDHWINTLIFHHWVTPILKDFEIIYSTLWLLNRPILLMNIIKDIKDKVDKSQRKSRNQTDSDE
ncbi:hypothetical protein BDQ12DRAFT_678434 [Crucibulum laeve]|uniref:Nephrocystin 3-like N-terminal domain-containing protein n=1 Tax=Crucibulum laeve TaxID=68775 RepID=A0A5C3MD10_9AGAR|nr:hypothetical protein BDQ12DRAFT_678434 [Crucibulum laeve]